eukprot:TRINITY_DN40792_c0_g1_i1.p1 TRINITY_DN40792_c0_g1~~TRINITY_DN40792_c0_g1_i1.p1  ORF type:complete len:408 (-),score=122.46 TRINITY_DN40792_c0_g1_i1:258-1481(-)
MGGSQSAEAEEISGVRVFKVSPGSPAAEAGLEVFFDFIISINGVVLEPGENPVFATKIQESENGIAKLQVYSTRANSMREVQVKPRKWSGTGLLGATVRFDIVDVAENHGIRVLEVFPNSPAAHSGLVPYQDFLLGTATRVFHDIDELVETVTANINQRIQVYVYNADSETVREATLVPNNDWGGEGCIGCDIGTGLLHRIPAPRRPPGGGLAAAQAATAAVTAKAPPGAIPTPPVAAAGLPAPAYPPGVAAPAAPAGIAVPGVAAGISPITGLPINPNIPGVPGIPPVPTAPGGATGLPGIQPGGAWPPATAAAPQVPVAQPTGLPPQATLPLGMPTPPSPATYTGPSAEEGSKAPPSTPLNAEALPQAVDLSAVMDPAKFAGAEIAGSPKTDAPVAAADHSAALL